MTRNRMMIVAAAAALSALCLPSSATDALAQGCAMCGTAVGNARDPLARSMASSILFMLSMPFALFASVGGWLAYRMRRRPKKTPGARHHPSTDQENPR